MDFGVTPVENTIATPRGCTSFQQRRIVASLDRKCLGAKMLGVNGSGDRRDIFDKETRRKPLAFAADAGYGK
jgi:hypothetical protein